MIVKRKHQIEMENILSTHTKITKSMFQTQKRHVLCFICCKKQGENTYDMHQKCIHISACTHIRAYPVLTDNLCNYMYVTEKCHVLLREKVLVIICLIHNGHPSRVSRRRFSNAGSSCAGTNTGSVFADVLRIRCFDVLAALGLKMLSCCFFLETAGGSRPLLC